MKMYVPSWFRGMAFAAFLVALTAAAAIAQDFELSLAGQEVHRGDIRRWSGRKLGDESTSCYDLEENRRFGHSAERGARAGWWAGDPFHAG